MPELSLVVPVYNEEENLPLLFDAIRAAIGPLGRPWEVIFVDDGSQDGSRTILERLHHQDADHVRVIEFRRNFGQTAAIAAGIDHARGEVIILLDADLQNDPADIPMLLAKLDEGYDLVSGWRRNRKDNAITRNLPSHLANWLISRVTGVHLHDYGCTLKVVLDLFTVKFLLDYSSKPIYLFGGAGLVLMFLGLLDLLYLFIRRFWGIPASTSPLLLVGVMFAIMGFQAILMGLIAELLVRTYHESQSKTTYHIRTTLEKNSENE